jgi:hypothetical protein
LFLNLDKRNIIDFRAKNSAHSTLCIVYKKKYIVETINTKFIVLQTDNHLNWKNNIERIIPKLSEAFYAVRLIVHISNINISKLIYYEHFLSITKCGKFWGGKFSNSGKIFSLQKKIVKIIVGVQHGISCRCLFKQLETLRVPWH